jgi:hypothetical protein
MPVTHSAHLMRRVPFAELTFGRKTPNYIEMIIVLDGVLHQFGIGLQLQ